MQKRNRIRSRKMHGGFLDSLTSSISSGWNSLSQGASNMWNKTKNAAANTYTASTTAPSSYTPSTASMTPTYGGRKRSRKMRGGYEPNSSTTNLAATAEPISGIKTAQPHNWVGGKTRRHRKNKHSRSHRHRKH